MKNENCQKPITKRIHWGIIKQFIEEERARIQSEQAQEREERKKERDLREREIEARAKQVEQDQANLQIQQHLQLY